MKHPSITYCGRAGDFKPIRSMVTVSGDSEVLIENCRQINECSDIKCSLVSAGFLIEVWGTSLSVSSFANGSASVCGKVHSVCIERKSKRESAAET